ncbi:MAG: glutathione S-transferase [Acetobacteraceae bacterium]
MKLYHHPLSGHAHRARLFLSLIDVEHELIEVDLAAGQHRDAPFLKLNRFGQVPVLDDDGTIIPDSVAILVYLAKKFGRRDWLPEGPAAAASVQRWLSVATGQIAYGPCAARLVTVFGYTFDTEEVIARAHAILEIIEAELAGRDWIVGSAHPTVADVALYSYIARAPEGNVDLAGYANVNAWLRRVEALPGFVAFQRSPIGLDQA